MIRLSAFCAAVIAVNSAALIWLGAWIPNQPDRQYYPVRGAALSDYMGQISWGILERQNIDFVYLRATKGTSFADSSFAQNWETSKYSALLTGAIHDFDHNTDGAAQAENFISAAGDSMSGKLIPALDITMSLWERLTADPAEIIANRAEQFILALEEKYRCKVVLICDRKSYELLVEPFFSEQPIWIISHSSQADHVSHWELWEYSDKGKLSGYEKSTQRCALMSAGEDITLEELKKSFMVP